VGNDRLPAGTIDRGTENDPLPAPLLGGELGWAMALPAGAAPALTARDAFPLTLDATGALRTTGGGGGGGGGAGAGVQVSTNGSVLATGATTITVRTVPALLLGTLKSLLVRVNGTVLGVTVHVLVGAVQATIPVASLSTGQFVQLIPPGMLLDASAAAVFAIQVEGGTNLDTLDFRAHFLEATA